MKRTLLILVSISLLGLPLAAAQQSQNLDRGPGMISSNSPIYGLEVTMDNAAVSVGLAKADGVAQERAAEAKKTADKGNYKAAQKAAKNMEKVAKKAKGNQTEGLQKAESVLQGVMADAPEEAQEGLQTALDNVRKARENSGKPEDAGPNESMKPESPGNQQDKAEQGGESTPEQAGNRSRDANTTQENQSSGGQDSQPDNAGEP
jgi:vacuolar-type H+-ATPase subunit H